jgi:hypothetical protein
MGWAEAGQPDVLVPRLLKTTGLTQQQGIVNLYMDTCTQLENEGRQSSPADPPSPYFLSDPLSPPALIRSPTVSRDPAKKAISLQ